MDNLQNPKLLLQRTYTSTATIGVLFHNAIEICFTLELPDKNNQRQISCIPSGLYPDCYITNHQTFGKCLVVPDVLNRKGILFHTGNTLNDTKGCILVGNGFLNLKYLNESKSAMAKVIELIRKVSPDKCHFDLEII